MKMTISVEIDSGGVGRPVVEYDPPDSKRLMTAKEKHTAAHRILRSAEKIRNAAIFREIDQG